MKKPILKRREVTKRDITGALIYTIVLGALFFYSTHYTPAKSIIAAAIAGTLYFVVMLYLPVKRKS